jgi:hypothetical protein
MKKTTSSKSPKKNVKAVKRGKPKAAKIIENKDNKNIEATAYKAKQDICENAIFAATIEEAVIEATNMSTDNIELVDTGSANFEAVETGSIEEYNEAYKQDSYNNDSVYTAPTSIGYKPCAPTTCGQNKDGIVLFLCISVAAIIILWIMLA